MILHGLAELHTLLECPSSRPVCTLLVLVVREGMVPPAMFDIWQIHNTLDRSLIPGVHGIDCFGKLGTALLVYAAGIDPYVLYVLPLRDSAVSFLRESTSVSNFAIAFRVRFEILGELFERFFIRAPSVREDIIGRNVAIEELFQLQRVDVDKSHVQ